MDDTSRMCLLHISLLHQCGVDFLPFVQAVEDDHRGDGGSADRVYIAIELKGFKQRTTDEAGFHSLNIALTP